MKNKLLLPPNATLSDMIEAIYALKDSLSILEQATEAMRETYVKQIELAETQLPNEAAERTIAANLDLLIVLDELLNLLQTPARPAKEMKSRLLAKLRQSQLRGVSIKPTVTPLDKSN